MTTVDITKEDLMQFAVDSLRLEGVDHSRCVVKPWWDRTGGPRKTKFLGVRIVVISELRKGRKVSGR